MSEIPDGYFRDTNGMLKQSVTVAASEAEHADLSRLDSMSKQALIALIIKMGGVDVALMTKTEIAEAYLHRLATESLDKRSARWESAGREWLDREKGKAVTPIAAQIVVKDEKPVDKRELARKIDFLMSMVENEGETVLLPPTS